MLPEFSDVYDHFLRMVDSAIAASHQKQLKRFASAKHRMLYEGNDFERNSNCEGSTWKRIEETVAVSNEEADSLSLDELVTRFAEVGASIGRQAAAHYHSIVRKYAEEADQLVDEQPNEDLSETILRLLEKIDVGEEGDSFTIFFPPGRENDFNEAFNKIDNTPHLAARKKAIDNAIKERQRCREANRKLVD